MNHRFVSNAGRFPSRQTSLAGLCLACLWFAILPSPALAAPAREHHVTVLEKEGRVEAARAGATTWEAARTNQILRIADRVRTGERSRATLHLLDQSSLRMFELSEFLIEPLPAAPEKPGFSLSKGLIYFFHRDKPVDVQFKTRTATAAIRGTEFHLAVEDNGRTVLTLFDGEVDLSNALGAIQLKSGEQGVVEPGQAPVKTPVIAAINIIQWCLYYPGVLNPVELNFDANEQTLLQDSIAAYRAGDLLAALAAWPEGRVPVSESENIYLAALLLSVGKVEQAETLLPPGGSRADALRELIEAVKNVPATNSILLATNSATAALARSYRLQSQSRLPEALQSAEQAVALAPGFGFGWARVAELEFSFGHTKQAMAALEKSLALTPRNAQAVALRGFAFAAQNRIREATSEFERAIALDGALGNAWLGRGLCRIRRGNISEGRDDLQVAATLEPQRALFRSYLGKAWSELGNPARAERELALAKERDVNDPTAWLYSALLLQQGNRINEAVGELEHSQELNDHRRVYRSRLLLDQDRAVRGANLANIYRDVGMTDWSVREAGKAVNADYANYSAHLFLANSYNELRDPRSVNLRYETPYLSEYLMANLLAPVGAGTLSQSVSQQEYSKLFERDRLGFASATEYSSRGAWSQSAVQFGLSGNSAYALEAGYLWDPGQRPNQDVERLDLSAQFKHQLTPNDSLYFQVASTRATFGDLSQYYDPATANRRLRYDDDAEPYALLGWHHEWHPGSHTLVLGSFARGLVRLNDPLAATPVFFSEQGTNTFMVAADTPQTYRSRLEFYGVEAQQIWQLPEHSIVAGVRGQAGHFRTDSVQVPSGEIGDIFFDVFSGTPVMQDFSTPFHRVGVYLYDAWQVLDALQLVGGVAYDHLGYPQNFRFAPIQDDTATVDELLPKAGFIWRLARNSAVRFAFTRSLGGVSFDQSFRLEPSQVAGFNQAYRSLIPETLEAANAGARFQTFDLAWEHRFPTATYLGINGQVLQSSVNRWRGAYQVLDFTAPPPVPTHLTQRLDYEEKSVAVTLDQLLGAQWVLGARYRYSRARLDTSLADTVPLPATGGLGEFYATTFQDGDAHEVTLRLLWNHPSGFFAGTEGSWWGQSVANQIDPLTGSDFWQWNAQAGWRSPRRHAEISVGLLNILGEANGQHPINLHREPAQQRTLAVSLRISF
ncbi:MAG: FecR domain-containing protein [Akkermansiaceae bacterium]|nr:FecR domain-containing protein [Verrucomicrobiales bacterium]